MGDIEKLIRQIVREELTLYLKEKHPSHMRLSNTDVPEKKQQTVKDINYDSFEQKYQAALKLDNEVNERYTTQIKEFGTVITLENASNILKMSIYSIRKLAKTDKNFPVISGGKVGTARLMHWLDGGKAYWNIGEDND